MNQTLTLRPVARSHEGQIVRPTDPVFFFEVDGMPDSKTTQILNLCPQGRGPSWQIRDVATDTYRGDFATAEEAFAVLETEVNS